MKLFAILPELFVAGACLVAVPAAGWCRHGRWRLLPLAIVAVAMTAALLATIRMFEWSTVAAFGGGYRVDGLAHVWKLLILSASLLALGLLAPYFGTREIARHAPAALVFATLGAMLAVSALDLVVLLLALQLVSTAGYVLTGLVRGDRMAQEAMLKYFLFGAVALAIMAYGLTFLYGMTGTLRLDEMTAALGNADPIWVTIALGLVLVGYGFEIAFVPFHFWIPDVLAGSTAPVAGFLSVVPKLGAAGALLRLLLEAYGGGLAGWPWLVAVAAAITMTAGNLVALRQVSLKRMLAYSSIAQAGYVLMAIAVAGAIRGSVPAIAYYLATYAIANLAAFAVVAHVERAVGTDARPAFEGLSRRAPLPAAVLALALLSLAGIPPLAGFAGKVLVLEVAMAGDLVWLALIAALNWVVALFYYVRIAADLYARHPARRPVLRASVVDIAVYALVLAGLIALGVVPGAILEIFAIAA